MAGLKTLIGNITQDPNGPSETIIKKDASEEMKGSFIVGLLSSMSDAERNDFFEFTAKRTNMSVEELKSKLVNELNDKLDLNMPSDVFDMGESHKVDNSVHFNSDIYGEPRKSDADAYARVTRSVVADNYIESLADQYNMSVDEINAILNEIPMVPDKGMVVEMPDTDMLPDKGMIVDNSDAIRKAYNEYMAGYDAYANGDSQGLSRQSISKYGKAMDAAQSEVDSYLEARESLNNTKDNLSVDAYNKLLGGLIETNPAISESIGMSFPESEESKIMCPHFESGLSGIDIDIPHEPIAIGPVEPENPINPSFPWNKQEPTPKPMPYRPWLDGGDVIITGEPDYINPDGTNPGQGIEYKDALYDGSSSLKNALGKVTDKVSEFGQKITSSLDNVVNNKTNRGHEFDDIVDESSTDTQFDK